MIIIDRICSWAETVIMRMDNIFHQNNPKGFDFLGPFIYVVLFYWVAAETEFHKR